MLSTRCAWIVLQGEFAVRVQPAWAVRSRQQTRHNAGRHRSGELLIEPLKLIRQLVVVDPQAVQDGCVEVAHRDGIFDYVVAVVVGLAVDDAWAHAAPTFLPRRQAACARLLALAAPQSTVAPIVTSISSCPAYKK